MLTSNPSAIQHKATPQALKSKKHGYPIGEHRDVKEESPWGKLRPSMKVLSIDWNSAATAMVASPEMRHV